MQQQDIRQIAQSDPLGLRHWHNCPTHPGFNFCYCTTGNRLTGKQEIHIARKTDFKVIGTFSSWREANAFMLGQYGKQETEAPSAA